MRFASMQYSKMRLRLGLRPDPAGGAYSAPQDPLAGFKGAAGRGVEGREEKGREEEGREEQEGRGSGGDGRLTPMRSWNRAADWLRL